MENLLKNTTALARAVCQNYIDAFRKSADKNGPLIAVDATCGNGHDALWLAEVCDRVYAFDIQPEAVKTTAELLGAHNRSEKVELFCESHANMKSRVSEKAAVIVFNLGYLPGGDKEITTHTESTLCALQAALASGWAFVRDRLLGAPVRQRGAGSGIGMGEKPGQEHFPLCSYRHAEPAELSAGDRADNEEKRGIKGMSLKMARMRCCRSFEKWQIWPDRNKTRRRTWDSNPLRQLKTVEKGASEEYSL